MKIITEKILFFSEKLRTQKKKRQIINIYAQSFIFTSKLMTYLNFQMIGDHQVGKTALINAYTAFIFRDEFYPNILDFYTKHFFYKDEGIVLNIFDLSGCAAEYRKIRLYQFDNIDVFLVCFSIDIKQSLENAEKKWIPEIKDVQVYHSYWLERKVN